MRLQNLPEQAVNLYPDRWYIYPGSWYTYLAAELYISAREIENCWYIDSYSGLFGRISRQVESRLFTGRCRWAKGGGRFLP